MWEGARIVNSQKKEEGKGVFKIEKIRQIGQEGEGVRWFEGVI